MMKTKAKHRSRAADPSPLPFLTLPGATFGRWETIPLGERPRRAVLPPYPLHQWQAEAYLKLLGQPLVWLNVPMGAGKSTQVMVTMGKHLIENPIAKALIAIPTTPVARSYVRGGLFKLPNGETIMLDGMVGNNMCDDSVLDEASKTKALLAFLEAQFPATTLNPTDFKDRVFLCSHALLARVYKLVRANPKRYRHLFDNLVVFIDEAHKVLNDATEEDEDEGVSPEPLTNLLGGLVHTLLKRPPKGGGLWLVTATAFRGDGLSMLPAKDKARFTQYTMDFERYWREVLVDIQGYYYDFAPYIPGRELDVLRQLVQAHRARGVTKGLLIYMGDSRHTTSNGCKYRTVREVAKVCREELGRDIEILDLVTDDAAREARKLKLVNDPGYSPDVIISIKIMGEGVDYPAARCVIDMAPSQSLTAVVQRFGRLTRNAPGKDYLYYTTLLAVPLEGDADREAFIQRANENLACIMAAQMLEDMGQPRRFGRYAKVEGASIKEVNTGGAAVLSAPNHIHLAFPDPNEERRVRTAVWLELTKAYAEAKVGEGSSKTVSNEEATEIVRAYLRDECGVAAGHLEDVTLDLLEDCRRLMYKGKRTMQGLGHPTAADMVSAGFKPFSFMEEMEGGWLYTSGACGVRELGKFREMMRDYDERVWGERFEECKRLWEKTGDCHARHGSALWKWQTNQRSKRRGYADKRPISDRQIALLDSIDFDWEPQDSLWHKGFNASKILFNQTGDCHASTTRGTAMSWLGRWQSKQRGKRRVGGLSADQIKLLDLIGFRWDLIDDIWNRFLNNLDEYRSIYGNVDVPWSYKTSLDYKLGAILSSKRVQKQRNRLNTEQIRDLDKRGIRWGSFFSFRPFENARTYMHSQRLKSFEAWCEWAKSDKRPRDIPTSPSKVYKKDWAGLPDWLGYKPKRLSSIDSIEDPREARTLILPLKIRDQRHYQMLSKNSKLPPRVPFSPLRKYKNHPYYQGFEWFIGKKPYVFQSPLGELFETYNIAALARDCGLNGKQLSKIVRGEHSCHKGWTFVSGPKD